MPRQMVGSAGPHIGLHDESSYCEFLHCSLNDPDQMMVRRMAPHQAYDGDDSHSEEHDETPECLGMEPKCIPVVPVEVAAPAYDPPPKHYEGDGVMPWDVIDAWGLDYYLGNIVKYICRAGKKDIATRLDDLNKARNFINKAIELEEKK